MHLCVCIFHACIYPCNNHSEQDTEQFQHPKCPPNRRAFVSGSPRHHAGATSRAPRCRLRGELVHLTAERGETAVCPFFLLLGALGSAPVRGSPEQCCAKALTEGPCTGCVGLAVLLAVQSGAAGPRGERALGSGGHVRALGVVAAGRDPGEDGPGPRFEKCDSARSPIMWANILPLVCPFLGYEWAPACPHRDTSEVIGGREDENLNRLCPLASLWNKALQFTSFAREKLLRTGRLRWR